MAIVPLPPSIQTSLFCDLEASPLRRCSVFLHPLNLGLPCDLLWLVECGRCDQLPGPGLGLEGPRVLPPFASETC